MKTLPLLIATAVTFHTAFAQQPAGALPPLVTTNGSAQIQVVPDLADLNFEVEVRGTDLIARKQQAERATKVLATLRKAGCRKRNSSLRRCRLRPITPTAIRRV